MGSMRLARGWKIVAVMLSNSGDAHTFGAFARQSARRHPVGQLVAVLESRGIMAERLEWEALLASVTHELPAPVEQEAVCDGSVVLVGGQPAEVVVRLTHSMATVSEYAVEWQGPHDPAVRPVTFGTLRWRRMPEIHALATLQTLIRAARESRTAKFRACSYCGTSTPPERLHDDRTCQACAERHLGIVY